MNIKVELPKGNGAKIFEPFTVKEVDDIVLNFETEYQLNTAKIILKNEEVSGVYDFKRVFKVPDKFMFAGKLFGKVEMLIGSKVVKRWEIFPIRIRQTPEGLVVSDYLDEIEEQISNLSNRLKTIEKQHEIIK